ncbi:glycoside hydrolase family 97 protein [Sunxiuqinia elliptica]|uniref:Alpha-glucosidase n=1 Tax=Sunxiuqinia elliptica TaxID=655355 RepID=A0A1I2GVZ8_9BACT|nr:glycoside hydrolase family 97 protein [Sunxiuqinia elliptica]SFF20977.1 alpha-glucosidase [Sunxiuqinia elliptica]
MKLTLFITLSFLTILFSCNTKDIKVTSPSNLLEVKIVNSEEGLLLELSKSNQSLMHIDLGKFALDKGIIGNTYQIEDVQYTSKDETWKPVYGERNSVRNHYNELELVLKDKTSGKFVRIICRLYDEGVAFRYFFDQTTFDNAVVEKELTSFNLNGDYEAWVTTNAQGYYEKKHISQIEEACERPFVIRQNEQSYLAIGEAALVDFARMKLKCNSGKENSLQTELTGTVDLKGADYKTPWRYVMVAENPGELLENNYFVLNLNEPNKIKDTSWIKPGKVIREVTLTTKGGMACVDFAAKHNLQYVEFDAGWYGNEYDDTSDATTVTVDPKRSPGPLDLQYVINYAKEKGVGVILYVNRRALEKQLDEILPLYKSWDIAGLKYGFVNVGPQTWTSWVHDAVRKAADYQLMVDVHDEYRPTGYSRTFPNLITQEGIRGDEESPSTEHTLITLFTRMIAGAGDNTNCFLAPRVSEKMGGKAGQMAKAIMLYSPWQFVYWYDRPEGSPHKKGGAGSAEGIIEESEELGFYDALPTVWDETKVLEGEIGEYATVVRRTGEDWFVGSLTANKARSLEISFSFLDEGKAYEATIFSQDASGLEDNKVTLETLAVNQKTIFSRTLVENSGLAVIIRKK